VRQLTLSFAEWAARLPLNALAGHKPSTLERYKMAHYEDSYGNTATISKSFRLVVRNADGIKCRDKVYLTEQGAIIALRGLSNSWKKV